ncbi:MAG: hypothetical protein ACI9UQ_001794 [Candidatus Krumholzibacteriia bacterium]|jgi:hypothetical protein
MQYRFASLALILFLSSGAMTAAAAQRIVAIGDVHGDIAATRRALILGGAIDKDDRWIGGDLIVVQTGDQLDRGEDEQEILDLFETLRTASQDSGGAFYALLGNHEIMNAKADLRYVTEGGFADFENATVFDPADTTLARFPENQRARMAALLPGRPYALMLAERFLILQIDDNVFVHGGVLPHHVAHGIDNINAETQAWLRGLTERPTIIKDGEVPQWTRLYSEEPDADACEILSEVLATLGAKRMIMGHTVQENGITSYCDDQAWCIDVGLAARYGGETQVLEIVGDQIRVLKY